MMLDECPPWPCDQDYAARSLAMTIRWARSSKEAAERRNQEKLECPTSDLEHPTSEAINDQPLTINQLLFGIVQGATFEDLRRARDSHQRKRRSSTSRNRTNASALSSKNSENSRREKSPTRRSHQLTSSISEKLCVICRVLQFQTTISKSLLMCRVSRPAFWLATKRSCVRCSTSSSRLLTHVSESIIAQLPLVRVAPSATRSCCF